MLADVAGRHWFTALDDEGLDAVTDNWAGIRGDSTARATNAAKLGLMQGFPPDPDKRIAFGDHNPPFPKLRWSFHHLRELVPTLNVRADHGDAATVWRIGSPAAVDKLEFVQPNGAGRTIREWLDDTYTDGFIVLHKGTLAYEWYDAGVDPHDPHLLMSNTKSVVGLLATEMIVEGVLKPRALVVSYLPELRGGAWDGATVQQTLDMTTAVAFAEDYADANADIRRYAVAAGAVAGRPGYAGPDSIVGYLKTLKSAGRHGQKFAYRTVNPEVVAWIVQRVSGTKLNNLLSQRIWRPMGATDDAYFIVDKDGLPQAGGGLNATLRDTARFVDLVRNRGRVDGRQVVDPRVFKDLLRERYEVRVSFEDYPNGRAGYSYHNYWWLTNHGDGAIEMWGIHGQIAHSNPEAGVTIVKQSSRPVASNVSFSAEAERAFAAICAHFRSR